jgi:hypothetical protein
MKHKEYRQAYLDLRLDVITEINHTLIKDNASEIELHNAILHSYIDEQTNEVIRRVNVDTGSVYIDTGYDSHILKFDEISLAELLSILELIEAGSYEVWENFED